MRRVKQAIWSILVVALTAHAQGGHRHAAAPRRSGGAILLELFTSEGCSSCPPADELLGQMNGVRTPEGDLIVAISEHVTYWDHLGWRDRFSSEAFTERQKAYVQRFRLSEVYTPQMVINGESAMVGSDKRALLQGLMDAHAAKSARVQIVSAAEADGKLALTYTYKPGAEPAEVYAVVAEDHASSDVLRGENKGRTLHHVAVATAFARLDGDGTEERKTVEIPLTNPGGAAKRHVILFAQAAGLGPVVAVETVPF